MSYNSGSGNGGSRLPANRDRDRERERDRDRNSFRDRERDRDRNKAPGSSKSSNNRDRGQRGQGSVSAFGPGSTSNAGASDNNDSGSYRRHEPQRDYYNYRGNYNRRPNNSYGQNNRKRDSYDKYRPSNKNRPSSSAQRNDSWGDKRSDRLDNFYSYNDRSRGDRSEYKPYRAPSADEGTSSSSAEGKRLLYSRRLDAAEDSHEVADSKKNIKEEHEAAKPSTLTTSVEEPKQHPSSSKAKESEESQKETKKSEEKAEEPVKKEVPSVVNNIKEVSPPAKPEESAAKPEPQKVESAVEGAEPAKLLQTTDEKKEKLLHLFDDDFASDPPSTNKESAVDEQQAKGRQMEKDEDMERDEPEAVKAKEDAEIVEDAKGEEDVKAKENSKTEAPVLKLNEISSPVQPDHQQASAKEEKDEADESEAETIITSEPTSTEIARQYIRKRGADEERRRLKRKIIYSENESDDDDDAYHKPTSASASDIGSSNVAKESPSTGLGIEMEVSKSHVDTPQAGKREELEESGESSDAESDKEHNNVPSKSGESQRSKPKKSYKMKRDSTGRSLLQRACKKGDLDAVKNLIAKGADANESDFGGFTCLHEAALAGHTEIVKYLIKKGADVNRQALEAGDSETPLMDAAENKHIETVEVLLENGADPNITNVDGFSALTKLYHLQSEEDDYTEVIRLLNRAADNSSRSRDVLQSPRKVIEDPNEAYFNDLIKKKTPSSTIYKYVAQGLKEAAAEDFILQGYSLSKKPDILILAARHGHAELVDILLGLNPGSFDMNTKNRVGVTILLASVGRGNYEVVKLLLSRGADPSVKRDQDGLNALQIAKHSAQHDPREVFLIERHLSKKHESSPPPPSSPSPVNKEVEKDTQPIESSKPSHFTSTSGKMESSKTTTTPESVLKRSPSEDFDTVKPKKHKQSTSSTDSHARDQTKSKSEASKSSTGIAASGEREKTPEFQEGKSKLHRSASGASLSPGPISKAQEEQKQKALEEAKIWQEKVEAKKRARKEMFLQAEKEKERKRKEDEEKRAELEKQQKLKAREEETRKAQEAEKLAKDLESKRKNLELELILEKYPVGLRHFAFGQKLSKGERLKYCPLYVFEVAGRACVVDLQVSLLLAQPVLSIHDQCKKSEVKAAVLDAEDKAKLWPLFYPMVGIGPNQRVEPNSMSKFLFLQLTFLDYEETMNYVKSHDPELYEDVWANKREVRVSLKSLPLIREESQGAKDEILHEKAKDEKKQDFVPPRWRLRQDVLQTIRSAHTPLW